MLTKPQTEFLSDMLHIDFDSQQPSHTGEHVSCLLKYILAGVNHINHVSLI